jgi:hypothetical protein
MMNLKSCPSGEDVFKSSDYHLDLGKAWQPGLLELRNPFSRVAKTATHSWIGQVKDNQNQLEERLPSGQWLFQIP